MMRSDIRDKLTLEFTRRKQSPITQKWMDDLPKMVARIEEILWEKAKSVEEYANEKTLLERVKLYCSVATSAFVNQNKKNGEARLTLAVARYRKLYHHASKCNKCLDCPVVGCERMKRTVVNHMCKFEVGGVCKLCLVINKMK